MDFGKSIRIKDIAKLAGVSVGTVDRVLHNRGRVSDSALQKVTAVMNQIEYKPNLIARTLGSNKNYRIAALIPDPTLDPYWAQTNLGIIQAQKEWSQYGIIVETIPFDLYNKESFHRIAREVIDDGPDAILVAPIFYYESVSAFELFQLREIPYILFNTNILEGKPLGFIGQNLTQSGRVGAQLMNLGQHEPATFAILHIDEDVHDSIHLLEKEKGFREYFKEQQKSKFEIVDLSLNPHQITFDDQMRSLLERVDLKGIFVSTSKGTAVAASFVETYGKSDIRLIGYDILQENLKYLKSGTIDFLINQNPKRQAQLGISHLANHLMFKRPAPQMDLFPLEIITQQNVDSYLESGIH
ncbi:MAG: substrate-binding domain-containing protein [Cyclobacteriaceae bacterium]|nr:substrate-binding domain-containing protein [Cyclobacteriaceae bacterium]MDH4298979.1 substrate-binding domain-containing protein [Cyclobacteriaceae bacterium]MDH5249545.1 substrate-binding domain-containing protein [Cyclobacteriaceae bacterium]